MHTIKISDILRNDYKGFSCLIKIQNIVNSIFDDHIALDFTEVTWVEANLCAILGAIINIGLNNNNKISISGLKPSIEKIFSKNGFLPHFNLKPLPDTYNTTIKYTEFKPTDRIEFCDYIAKDFIPKTKLQFSPGAKNELRTSLEEMFQNARIHGNTDKIITCGQCYHKTKYLNFTVIDLGLTIPYNVNKFLDKSMNSVAAIEWATISGHSTKKDSAGGLGICQVVEFVELNKGTLHIISHNGFWFYDCTNSKKIKSKKILDTIFYGTIINIKVNSNDNMLYVTSDEMKQNNIRNIF